jgi:site-specific DNA-cytosine methylase
MQVVYVSLCRRHTHKPGCYLQADDSAVDKIMQLEKRSVNEETKNYIHNIRPLTTTERSYLQTFPKDFKWFGSKTEQEQIVGNAVPVNLAKFVGNAIMEYQKAPVKKSAVRQLSLEMV